jgi:hypothetical protein
MEGCDRKIPVVALAEDTSCQHESKNGQEGARKPAVVEPLFLNPLDWADSYKPDARR